MLSAIEIETVSATHLQTDGLTEPETEKYRDIDSVSKTSTDRQTDR